MVGYCDVGDQRVGLRDVVSRVPEGWTSVEYGGRRWGLSRVSRVGGRVVSLYADELGGAGIVSANVYLTRSGDLLKPCEMPAETVLTFLAGWEPTRARPTASDYLGDVGETIR